MYAFIETVKAAAPTNGCPFRAKQAAMRLAAMAVNQRQSLARAILADEWPLAEIAPDGALFSFSAAHCGYWGAW